MQTQKYRPYAGRQDNRYAVLRVMATILKVIAFTAVGIGLVIMVAGMVSGSPGSTIAGFIGGLGYAIFGFVFNYAMGEVILLLIETNAATREIQRNLRAAAASAAKEPSGSGDVAIRE